ncbi:MAG: DegT/DnrJ/EryC1/StrS family aminotransferase, partial [Mucilaginibacter sp.]|nr:DegT/DnrJ/EryC1/StrS family aminotransferase [Mucilaginibacter sp.]
RLADIVAWAGLTPNFCEVHREKLCITAETAEICINEKTALILGVHPIVNCCDSEGLEALSARTGIPLMFDAVESVYETFNGRKVGSFGLAECFSMQSSKLFNAFEGGYVTTNDEGLANRLRAMRQYGINNDGELIEHGMNAKQNEMHAAMALAALDDVDLQVEQNRRRYHLYQKLLATIPGMRLVFFDEREKNGYKNIVVELLDDWPLSRELTLRLLHRENMLCRPYYSPALHQKKTGYPMVWGDLRQSEELARRFLMLPCGFFVSDDDVHRIVEFLHSILRFQAELTQYEEGDL